MSRLSRHLLAVPWAARRVFTAPVLDAIETAIRGTEATHGGELRFAIEGTLRPQSVMRGQTPRDRAIEVFSDLRIWDTEANNGVLIYVLWAERQVEIVADRGLNAGVTPAEWATVCRQMESAFVSKDYAGGATRGIAAVGTLIARHFPRVDRNELPDRPVML